MSIVWNSTAPDSAEALEWHVVWDRGHRLVEGQELCTGVASGYAVGLVTLGDGYHLPPSASAVPCLCVEVVPVNHGSRYSTLPHDPGSRSS